MPGNAVEIDTRAVNRLSKQLDAVAVSMKTKTVKKMLKLVGTYIKKAVEERYANRGPNKRGQRWEPILLSSYAQRGNKTLSKSSKSELAKARSAGKTSRKKGAPTSNAKPLVTANRKPQAVISYAGDEMRVGPNETRLIDFGHARGLPIDVFASDPSISGVSRTTGTQPERDAYYLNAKNENDIMALAEKTAYEDVEQELSK